VRVLESRNMSVMSWGLHYRGSANMVRVSELRAMSVMSWGLHYRDSANLVRVSKLRTMSAMKRPSKPKMPPLAPATAAHLSSNAALKKLPAAPLMTFAKTLRNRSVACRHFLTVWSQVQL